MKAFVIFAIAFLAVASAKHQHGKPGKLKNVHSNSIFHNNNQILGYYWRDFNGTVPRDAIKVAQKTSFEPVYIGQGYFEGVGLLPGMLKNGMMEMSVAAQGRVYTTAKNIKVIFFCSSRVA